MEVKTLGQKEYVLGIQLKATSDSKVGMVILLQNSDGICLWFLSSLMEKAASSFLFLLGSEFLIPITGFYCQLCEEFLGDPISGEQHVKGHQHNEKYKVGL